jgi:hypothetical protein
LHRSSCSASASTKRTPPANAQVFDGKGFRDRPLGAGLAEYHQRERNRPEED